MIHLAIKDRSDKGAEWFIWNMWSRLLFGFFCCCALRMSIESARWKLEVISDQVLQNKFHKEAEKILGGITDSSFMAEMHVKHRELKNEWESGNKENAQDIFEKMKPKCNEEGKKLGIALGKVREALEKEWDRNKPLFEIEDIKGKPLVKLPDYASEDNKTGAEFLERKGEWMLLGFKKKLIEILDSTDNVYNTKAALDKNLIRQEDFDKLGYIAFEPERRPLRPHQLDTKHNGICGLLTAPVKGAGRSIAKANADYTVEEGYPEQPGIRYVGDWLRATFYASDGAALALMYYVVANAFGGCCKVKNKLAVESLPDEARISIMMSIVFKDPHDDFEMVCEVQLIPQDMLTIKDIQHITYEVARAEKLEDVVGHPIFVTH
jgi:hypothetical protein